MTTDCRISSPDICLGRLRWILLLLALGGCISEHSVTMRPEYAYPQNLVSLCSGKAELNVHNIGEFESTNWDKRGKSQLLLSSQLLPQKPEQQRLYQYLHLEITSRAPDPEPGLKITGFEADGQAYSLVFPQASIHCSEEGELLLEFDASSNYLWASMITKDKTLALWTNPSGGLVLQNRWQEKAAGIVGGTISGDAWAEFRPLSPEQLASVEQWRQNFDPEVPAGASNTAGCAELDGDYQVKGRVVHLDGTLDSRYALDQFFREAIVGANSANQNKLQGNRLSIQRITGDNSIELQLFEDDELLVKRRIEASNISCNDGKWFFKGDKKVASAWLLIIASGGVSWEDLTLWKDRNGDLLVEGVYKTRNALMLVPLGDTVSLFMVFPRL